MSRPVLPVELLQPLADVASRIFAVTGTERTRATTKTRQAGKAKTKVISTPAKWFGVTYREDREMVVNAIRGLVKEGKYPEKLWS